MESREDMDIKQLCALCKTMPCCPEHCCDWDTCKCTDCEYCKSNTHKGGVESIDPSILIMSTGTEEVKKIKKSKKDKKLESDKDKELHIPSEQTRANDGALIINYEVPIEEEEDKVVYSGGIKGIRALRTQREALNEQINEDLIESRNKFSKYEEQKR